MPVSAVHKTRADNSDWCHREYRALPPFHYETRVPNDEATKGVGGWPCEQNARAAIYIDKMFYIQVQEAVIVTIPWIVIAYQR